MHLCVRVNEWSRLTLGCMCVHAFVPPPSPSLFHVRARPHHPCSRANLKEGSREPSQGNLGTDSKHAIACNNTLCKLRHPARRSRVRCAHGPSCGWGQPTLRRHGSAFCSAAPLAPCMPMPGRPLQDPAHQLKRRLCCDDMLRQYACWLLTDPAPAAPCLTTSTITFFAWLHEGFHNCIKGGAHTHTCWPCSNTPHVCSPLLCQMRSRRRSCGRLPRQACGLTRRVWQAGKAGR